MPDGARESVLNFEVPNSSPTPSVIRRFRARRTIVSVAFAAVAASGVAVAYASGSDGESGMILGDASSFLSQETVSDVVTFSDVVLVVEVTDEEKVEDDRIHETEDGSGNGPVARNVGLQVESVLWSGNSEHELPKDVLSVESWGWYVQETETKPFRVRGDERLSVGERYILPLGWDGAEWTPLLGASFHLEDGKVAPLDDQQTELSEQLSKIAEADLPEFFAAAEPLKGSEPFLKLPLRERAHAYYGQTRADQADPDQDIRD